MARLSHIVVPGQPHHVTQRGAHSKSVFPSHVNRREYPWSSTRLHVRILEHDPLVTDRSLLRLVSDWQGFLCSWADKPVSRLRRETSAGWSARHKGLSRMVEKLTSRHKN